MLQTDSSGRQPTAAAPRWQELVAPYRNPCLWRSSWQIANTFLPFLFTWFLMYLSLNYSYWLTLALTPVAAGLLVRLFIIQHDCGHNAFFKSSRLSTLVGSICGVFSFTPYHHWRHFHAIHHATAGNLNRRVEEDLLPLTMKKYTQNNGDVLTLTVAEYAQLSRRERVIYQFYRHPVFLFLVVPILLFLVLNRFCNPRANRRERYSVYGTNLALLAIFLLGGFTLGFGPVLLVELPILFGASTIGVWLFYIQHQFESTSWLPQQNWNFAEAALQGSSYYKLPRLLQWFTGNIGFHHIHHLSPRIPNYYLQKCHEASPLFEETQSINFKLSIKSLYLRLWDENRQKMVGFSVLRDKTS